MPTSFNVFSLGRLPDFDPDEGDFVAENAPAFVGATLGGPGNALAGRIQELSPGSTGVNGGTRGAYDQDGSPRETFRIDGGAEQTFDSVVVYGATLTYLDGTTAQISAVLFQDTEGNVYLAPEVAGNADQAALEAGPIQSITLDRLIGNRFSGLSADRQRGDFVPCFTPGARIATPVGERPVEALRVGDPVTTEGGGHAPIRWIGTRTIVPGERLRPVRIAAGALGEGLPRRDLTVSPQHRFLVRSGAARRMFGGEVLVPARHLTALPGIRVARGVRRVTYIHLLLDRHEVIYAEGAPTESLLTGEMVMEAIGTELAEELGALFPEVVRAAAEPARPIPAGRRAKQLVRRHRRNEAPLLG